jgi:hypothetical protein
MPIGKQPCLVLAHDVKKKELCIWKADLRMGRFRQAFAARKHVF